MKKSLGRFSRLGLSLLLMPPAIHAEQSATQAVSAQPIILTLQEAVLLSLRNNSLVKQDKIGRISQKFALVVAKYYFQPQYQFNAGYAYGHNVSNSSSSTVKGWTATPGATLNNHYGTQFSLTSTNPVNNGQYNPSINLSILQPLIRGFGKPVVDAALNNAKDQELINQLNFKNNIINIVVQVINDYLNLVASYQNLKVDQVTLKNFRQTVSNDHALIQAGKMARSDIVQAEAQVENQLASIESDLSSIDSNRNQLLDDLGLPPETNITVPIDINFKQVASQLMGHKNFNSVNVGQKTVLANNPTYQTNIITIRTLRRSLLQAQDARRWQVNLALSETQGGGAGNGDNSGVASVINNKNHAEAIGLTLSIPIDDVPAQAAVISAKVSLDQALIGLAEQKRQLLEQVDTQYRQMQSNKRSLEISYRALALQKQTLYISQQKQLAGKSSTFEVVSNQKDLVSAEQSVVQNEVTYLQSIVAYEQSLGTVLEPWQIKLTY